MKHLQNLLKYSSGFIEKLESYPTALATVLVTLMQKSEPDIKFILYNIQK